MFSRTCSNFLIPIIVVLTAGCDSTNRNAISGRDIPAGRICLSLSTRSSVLARFLGLKYRARQSLAREGGVLGHLPAQAAFVERHSYDHADVHLLAGWE